jgi:predicted GH43/DUF377 family glycosyl hydrolase
MQAQRFDGNPILSPSENEWEAIASFNGCPILADDRYVMLYRAQAPTRLVFGAPVSLSTIGKTVSSDGLSFKKRVQLITPECDWERFGCEDPRVTKIDDRFFIFYTAISSHPAGASGIKVALAVSKDLNKIDERHLVTPFNAKAMALFPRKINGQLTAVLTVHTDLPPVKIAVVSFPHEREMWNPLFWHQWYQSLDAHVIPIRRSVSDHIEVGAPPILTSKGWLLIYCHIQNYTKGEKVFRIDGLLLDPKNPQKVLGQTQVPYLVPKEKYELYGDVPNVIFPSGALIKKDVAYIYYGAADTHCCVATIPLDAALAQLV